MWVLHRVSGVKVIAWWRKPPEKNALQKKLRPIYRSNMKSGGVKGNSASLTRLWPLQGCPSEFPPCDGACAPPYCSPAPPGAPQSHRILSQATQAPQERKNSRAERKLRQWYNTPIISSPARAAAPGCSPTVCGCAIDSASKKKAGARSGDDCAPAVSG